MRRRTEILVLLICLVIVTTSFASTVTYDHRAIVIDGKRRVLISGSIHYPRSTPEMWPDLIQKSKDGGLDVIETYVFWNLHEPVRNQYNFEGRNDLVKFVKLVAEAGLYVHLRIGPYVCAEWNYGGFPLWLHFIPGIKFRTDNEPFKAEMRRFTAKIVEMMKQEKLYASQGGPIILSQIENEYGNIDSAYGAAAKPYIKWAAGMAISLDTGVPWVMCQQSDAPDPIVNSMSVIPSFMHESLNTNADSTDSIGSGWSWINEPIGISKASAFNKLGLLEQINTTADKSDYLWYSLSMNIKGDEPFLQDGSQTVLHDFGWGSFIIVMFMYHYNTIACACPLKLSAGSRTGNSDNAKVKLDIPITVVPGKNTIDLLSLTIGLQNYGAFFDLSGAGITGPVKLNGLSNGSSIDLSSQQWTYQVGLKGEDSGLPSGSSSEWVSQPALPKNQPLIWYKLAFATRKMGSLCSHVSDSHPLPMVMWGLDSKTRRASNPTLSLSCPSPNQVISAIKFASFGTPLGTCGSFSHGRCSSAKAHSIVQKVCVGSTSCSIDVSTRTLGDPCKGVKKSLAVEVSCA
ncbi:hypothetical protein PVK06_014217 [Gossypium arboreum]|uniref:beta-galactosidase n=1 Tax=Gossypium arboreum TaxID=29729 RepID=A0ABR0PUR5_GOSAR|nr:hypothetical protein PVK06_014217 [Gossypium arboreum]